LEDDVSITPDEPTHCWPIDETACDDWTEFDPAIQDLAVGYAGITMRMLTAYAVGACPLTVRPCGVPCVSRSSRWSWTGGTFVPVIGAGGAWINMTCGCAWGCSHPAMSTITLPGLNGKVVEVKVDGAVLSPTAYRIDNGNQLVRTDGEQWPASQDMAAADDQPGTFSVTYQRQPGVDTRGAWAAGILACEYAHALTGKDCSLPRSVTQMTRQGVTFTLAPGLFPNGLTGIRVIDAYILSINPHGLKEQPSVWSPDLDYPTVTTWTSP
jgi:hypothetical protein